MEKVVLFVHSAGKQGKGEGSHRLIEYLQKNLGNEYHLVVPMMPDPENPRYEAWGKKIGAVLDRLQGELLLVGHSLGGSVLLKYLSETKYGKGIKGIFLVATPFWGSKDWEIEEFELKKNFTESIAANSNVFLYHSYEDEWVPFQHVLLYAQQFSQATVRRLKGDEHEFYNGLPELVRDIKNI